MKISFLLCFCLLVASCNTMRVNLPTDYGLRCHTYDLDATDAALAALSMKDEQKLLLCTYLNSFREVLEKKDWERALSYCSKNVKTAAARYSSSKAFFKDVIPWWFVRGQASVEVFGVNG